MLKRSLISLIRLATASAAALTSHAALADAPPSFATCEGPRAPAFSV